MRIVQKSFFWENTFVYSHPGSESCVVDQCKDIGGCQINHGQQSLQIGNYNSPVSSGQRTQKITAGAGVDLDTWIIERISGI